MKLTKMFLTWNKTEEINNFTNDYIEEKLKVYNGIAYAYIKHYKEQCEHYHIAIYEPHGIEFTRLQKIFAGVHIERMYGTAENIIEYFQHNNTDKEPYGKEEIITKNWEAYKSVSCGVSADVFELVECGYDSYEIAKQTKNYKDVRYYEELIKAYNEHNFIRAHGQQTPDPLNK